jgi:hypothetical protein
MFKKNHVFLTGQRLLGAIDYYHNYWITDKNRHCVLKFDHDLNLLDIFGSHVQETTSL